MAYLSNSFDFEHMQNSTNWEAVNKKRSFVARKIHKINKVSVDIWIIYTIMLHITVRIRYTPCAIYLCAVLLLFHLTELFFLVYRLSNRYWERCAAGTPWPRKPNRTVRLWTRGAYHPKSWRTFRTSTSSASYRRRSCTTMTTITRTRSASSPDWACRSRNSSGPPTADSSYPYCRRPGTTCPAISGSNRTPAPPADHHSPANRRPRDSSLAGTNSAPSCCRPSPVRLIRPPPKVFRYLLKTRFYDKLYYTICI